MTQNKQKSYFVHKCRQKSKYPWKNRSRVTGK